MRIAFVYDTSYPETKGGVERRVWELARRLARRGHEVHLLVPHGWDGPPTIEREGVLLRGVCRSRPLYTPRGRRAVRPALVHAIGVLRLLRSERYDLIDCQIPDHPGALATWLTTRRRPETRLMITWHEAWGRYWVEEMGPIGHAGRQVERLVARLPGRHLAVSQHTADILARLGRRVEAVIPAGVDLHPIEVGSYEPRPSDVLFVGRLVPTKNLGLLIESIAILVRRGLRPRVLIVGDGPSRESWEQDVVRRGLSGIIEFVGILESGHEVVTTLQSTRVVALPSVREGFGMIALEAAAHGVPVVTVDHPRNAARHLVRDGVTGLCVPPTPPAFADALQTVLEDDVLAERLARGALEGARRASWDATTDDTEATYLARVA